MYIFKACLQHLFCKGDAFLLMFALLTSHLGRQEVLCKFLMKIFKQDVYGGNSD